MNKLVQNKNASVDEIDLRGRYEEPTQIVRLSALTYSREDFNSKFINALLDEINKTDFLDVLLHTSWS